MTAPSKELQSCLRDLINIYRQTYRRTILSILPDMTFRQFVYLEAIVRMDRPTYSEVAEKFKVSKPAVTAIVNKLIALGYMERIQSTEDKRFHHLHINEKGIKILEVESATAKEFANSMAAYLSEEEQAQFITIAQKIITQETQ